MSRIRLAVVFGVIATALVSAIPAQATFPGKNGKIAFRTHQVDNFSNSDLYVVEPDASRRTNLTADDPAHPSYPSWSADGNKLAYTSVARPGYVGGQVWTMNANGTSKTQITSVPDKDFASLPSWSPDGGQITYTQVRFSYATVNVINADGTGDRTIAGSGFPDVAGQPTWSPDGTKIAFYRRDFNESRASLWTVKPDGSDLTRICCDDITVDFPDWSPDSRTIVFHHQFLNSEGYYRVNADGSGLVKLFSPARDLRAEEPVWAPDGTRLVFAQSDNGSYGGHSLFTSRPDGSDLTRLTGPQPPSPGDREPSWQPIPGPNRSDYKNANKFCKAEQAFWGDQFASRYGGGANAYGKCVSQSH